MPISNDITKGHSERGADAKSQDASQAQARTRLSYAIRRQNPQEERRFKAAIDAFLSELVRQEMGRRD